MQHAYKKELGHVDQRQMYPNGHRLRSMTYGRDDKQVEHDA